MEFQPVAAFEPEALCEIFNDAFTNYIRGAINLDPDSLSTFIERDGIDRQLSKIFIQDGHLVGFGYIAHRGSSSRLAAMGIIQASAEKGIGTTALAHLISEARERGDRIFELEAFEQNARAMRLYTRAGFTIMRRLVGWEAQSPSPHEPIAADLQTVSASDIAKVVTQYGSPDLPWQTAGFSMSHRGPPDVGYRLSDAFILISDPNKDEIKLVTLIVLPESRCQGQATQLLSAVFSRHPSKKWVVSQVFPEEYGAELAAKFGFTRYHLNQVQMQLDLTAPKAGPQDFGSNQ
jgi:ribosomal protein S18 acetylase RimI-like enzyme